ncbi:methenyltetrahydrofolate synthase domain-containing protein isoform X1 [Hippopotamus amphibius kiboko]|uniref:methenyltetrahydrofolate synthase domain-containing protein isoform X1 n=2 Tax=Hippopotamus amphibius kiboko TaxID=575201 RepID=UPI002596C39F|nr:methenyltetrahydrofolate synthase domain-containing protein isoform X1 [Hippopotamus amphibius kiboko]
MEPRAGVSKQDIREQIWDYMESQNLADFPRPVHHRIPNFKGASRAAEHFPRLQAFQMARTVKVNPDAPQKNARFFVLDSKKTLLVPTPRLRTGLFNKITPPPGATKDILRKCATSQGVRNYSTPVGLDSRVLVDLVVVGSVAVSEKGWRIGKGEGYADLEYAMMVSMGAVSPATPVVTIVHDCQVVDIPETLLEDHDLTVDYILTPTRVITTGCERPKPAGIAWSKRRETSFAPGQAPSAPAPPAEAVGVLFRLHLKYEGSPVASIAISSEMLGRMPVLRSLRCREEQAGKDVTLWDEHRTLLGAQAALSTGRSPRDPPPLESGSMKGEDVPSNTAYVGNLPRDARVSELKRALSALGVAPLRLTWQGPQHRAFLYYRDPAEARQAVSYLQGFHLGANTVRVALAGQQRASDLAGSHTGELHPDHPAAIADL